MFAAAGFSAAGGSTFLPVAMAVWMKIWFSQTMGVDMPRPGIFTFHFTFSVSLQVVGGLPCGATPLASGPRHCGQFLA